jgi:signal transduction histidine kinase
MTERPAQPPPDPDPDLLVPGLLHELRQPLTAIDAALALLERSLGPALARHPDWKLLHAQVWRIGEILQGYDELLRADEAVPTPFPVEPVVSRAVELLAHRLRPLGRRFAFVHDGAHRGFGAPGALVHAATNLLANAIDAVDVDRGDGRVAVRILDGAGGAVEVRVSDEGAGIPAEVRGRIFEPRFTTKGAGKGSGLGLHVARRLMARYGGSVRLVEEGDPARLAWAVTEFCIGVPAPPEGTP